MEPSIINLTDANCHASSTGAATVSIVNGTPPFSYAWSGSSQNTVTVNDLFAGDHSVLISDDNGCTATLDFVIGEPPALQITSISDPIEICPNSDTPLTATALGGSTPYIFTWYEGNTVVGNTQTTTVAPTAYSTEYCVVLTEVCGSPADTACTIVTWPANISPTFVSDTTRGCSPSEINFQNTTESNIIANINFQFGDGNSVNVGPGQPFSNNYTYPGNFSVTMTVTTINGCVYDSTYFDYIAIGDFPRANFSWSPTQIPLYNPVANLIDMSSTDVVEWFWTIESGEPGNSTIQNPTVSFPQGEVAQYLVTLFVTNDFGCIDEFSNYVPVISDVLIFAPNTFTPDNDDYNEVWRVYMQGIDIYEFNLLIFNRWGQIVWESNNIDVPWDGTYNGQIVPDGTYVWKIRTKNPYNDNVYEFQGHLNVIR
jgi:gliding motility-associated-like protein